MVTRIGMAIAILLCACTFPEQPLPPGVRMYVVHAVLDPSRRYQVVSLSTTDGPRLDPRDIAGTTVSVIMPDGTPLVARQDSSRDTTGKAIAPLATFRIDLQAAGVALVPGQTYELRVGIPNTDVITGETTIPNAAPAPMPALADFDKLRDTVRLSWTKAEGARTYEVQVWWSQTYTYYGTYTYTDLRYSAYADSSVTLAGTAKNWTNDDIFPTPTGRNTDVTTRVQVFAVDDNYYEYYRLLGDPFVGAAPSHLKGALGVFGSVVPVAQQQLKVR